LHLVRYEAGRLRPVSLHAAAASNAVRSMLQDSHGNLWFGTQRFPTSWGGAIRRDGQQALQFTKEDGLGSNWVASIAEDSDGHLWFATPMAGVTRHDGE